MWARPKLPEGCICGKITPSWTGAAGVAGARGVAQSSIKAWPGYSKKEAGGGRGQSYVRGVVSDLGNVPSLGFQGPILNLSEPSAPEGTAVTVTCLAGPRVQVTLDGIPAPAPGQPVQFQLNATETEDRRIFFCSATLRVDGEILHRNSSVQLRVLCE